MPETFAILIDDERSLLAREGTAVAAVLLAHGLGRALCGIGVCMECRVRIDGQAHRLGCQTLCKPGMRVSTR